MAVASGEISRSPCGSSLLSLPLVCSGRWQPSLWEDRKVAWRHLMKCGRYRGRDIQNATWHFPHFFFSLFTVLGVEHRAVHSATELYSVSTPQAPATESHVVQSCRGFSFIFCPHYNFPTAARVHAEGAGGDRNKCADYLHATK